MLSGVKFIPRDQLNTDLNSPQKEKRRSGSSKDKKRKKSNSKYDSSSDDGDAKIRKNSRSKKWYSSSEEYSDYDEEDHHSKRKKNCDHSKRKKNCNEFATDEVSRKLGKSSKKRKEHYSESSSSTSESDDSHRRGRRGHHSDVNKQKVGRVTRERDDVSDESGGSIPQVDKESARRGAGLDWMLRPTTGPGKVPSQSDVPPEEPQVEEVNKANPRELNPYLKDNGTGYPEDVDQTKAVGNRRLSSSVVGDGGASWRLKALKRAQEQAAREGRKLEEVVEERHDSLGQLAVSAASSRAAHAHAHLHAIKDRKRGVAGKHGATSDEQNNLNNEKVHVGKREYLKDASFRHPEMREPKVHGSLSWRKRKDHSMSRADSQLISDAASHLNKFTNDGNFMRELTHQQSKDASDSSYANLERMELDLVLPEINERSEESPVAKQTLTANQVAAKAIQLKMKGKHEEAEKLLKEAEAIKMKQESGSNLVSRASEGIANRYAVRDFSIEQRKKEDDGDRNLAQKIVRNKQYSTSGQADDEYDFDDVPQKKSSHKRQDPRQVTGKTNIVRHVLTQQERCQFCFENPTRPRHLVVAIANFTYLMLPQWQQLVQGHCCILPMQHESSTRNIDDNLWIEVRNFKKCLIEMFRKQDKGVVFLETVVGLAKQRRHCLVECVPLPRDIARQAPLYFKKAIDEAEDEWSQHNAKKLIVISKEKGLRSSIPKDFPYFYVEFGLDEGFVHVIDDETQFKTSLGLDVVRGMLQLPEEDMYRRRRNESVEIQKKAVMCFEQEWEPFDWTKELRA